MGLRTLVAIALLCFGCSGRQAEKTDVSDVPKLDGDLIRFSENFAKRVGIKTAEVRSAGIVPSIAVVGTVAFDPQHVSRVGTRLRGLVRDVRRFEGDTVKQGELLATIDSSE